MPPISRADTIQIILEVLSSWQILVMVAVLFFLMFLSSIVGDVNRVHKKMPKIAIPKIAFPKLKVKAKKQEGGEEGGDEESEDEAESGK
ncbi:MAG: hypothetical protein LBM77_05065 [Spirochaetaceae bacterium]|jgi:hypothetical protein|nr:hypothetical protein [Spirochaetaceae bacterium]